MNVDPTPESLLPNWSEAELHAQAISTRRPVYQEGDQAVCKCCNNILEREKVNICNNKKSLCFLGYGVPLYYLFIKYCVILVLLLIVTDGIISVYKAVQNNNLRCQHYFQPLSNPTKLRTLNTPATVTTTKASQILLADRMALLCGSFYLKVASLQKKTNTPEVLLRVSAFIIHLLFLIYIKISLFHTGEYYNEISVDLADYSVIFKNLPIEVNNKRTIFHSIVTDIRNQQDQPFEYYDILVIPRKDQLENHIKEREHTKSKYLHARIHDQEKAEALFQDYLAKNQQIRLELEQSRQELIDDCIPCENVIITFNEEPVRQEFMSDQNMYFIKKKLEYYFEGAEGITVEQAPGPKEIVWSNLKYKKQRNFKIFLSWALSILFLALTLVVFYFINMFKANLILSAQFDFQNNNVTFATTTKTILARVVAWLTFICIILYNKFVMGKVLHHFTDMQHHDDKADYAYSFAFKYSVGMFFTTCLMTVTVQALVHHNYYSHPFGVVEEESLMFIFSAVLVPLIWLLNPYQLVHEYHRWKEEGSQEVTQSEANKLMADHEYDVGKRYAEIIQMMWFTYLYADLIPAGMFVMILGLIAYYWVDKYNLLRRSSVTYTISAELSFKISDLIDWTLFWRFFGEFIFDYQLRGQIHAYTIVLLVLSLIYIVLPMRKIVSFLAAEDFNPNYRNINKLWNNYFKYHNYRSTNPLYVSIVGKDSKYNFSSFVENFQRGVHRTQHRTEHRTEHRTDHLNEQRVSGISELRPGR